MSDWDGFVGEDFRGWVSVTDATGAPRAGLANGDFLVSIVKPDDSDVSNPTVTESTQATGLYYFNVAGAYLDVSGNYGVQVEVLAAGPPLVATSGKLLRVAQSDVAILSYGGAIWVSATTGTAGTVVGLNGTPDNPVLDLADAITLLGSTGLSSLVIASGDHTLVAALNEIEVALHDESSIDFNGNNVGGSAFTGGRITGAGSGAIVCRQTILDTISGVRGSFYECGFLTSVALASGATSTFARCHSQTPGAGIPTLNMVGAGRSANLPGYSGRLNVSNMSSGGNRVTVHFLAGELLIDASCTAGTLRYGGNVYPVTDNSTGTTIIDNSTAFAVQEEPLAGHTTAGSAGDDARRMFEMLGLDATKPYVNTATGITVGDMTFSIVEAPAGTFTLTRTA